MQVQVISLVIFAVLSAAFAEVYFQENFKEGKTIFIIDFNCNRSFFLCCGSDVASNLRQ